VRNSSCAIHLFKNSVNHEDDILADSFKNFVEMSLEFDADLHFIDGSI